MDISSLQKIVLFQDIDKKEIENTLNALSSFGRKYKKNATIFHAGTVTDYMGIVIDGSVIIESNDMWGNRTILSHESPSFTSLPSLKFARKKTIVFPLSPLVTIFMKFFILILCFH